MNRIFLYLLLCLTLLPIHLHAQWQPDILGNGYEMRYVDQGHDYSGPVRSTIIRLQCPFSNGKGVLYVHGYNDYFFQSEMGQQFIDHGYDFYAVDLRKYGRSLLPEQRRFEVRDMHEYFADIDSALYAMKANGIDEVVIIGHSTGGLTTSLYMSEYISHYAGAPQGSLPFVYALVLNSPFLDWNMNGFMRHLAIPAVSSLASSAPNLEISNGNSTAYGESLLKSHHGEWEYNTEWKTFYPQKVTTSWIRAIDQAQSKVQNEACIVVPVLLLHSDKSVYSDKWIPLHQQGDAVLSVDHISKYGRKLGCNVTEVTIANGLHDLILSSPEVRQEAYSTIFSWLSSLASEESK